MSPIVVELTPEEYNPIASEPHYIIIQSSNFPSGEIRGQIECSTVGGEGEGEGTLAELLLDRFQEADTSGDGLISRSESAALFPDLTGAEFDNLGASGDGFLSRAELGGTPGGCFGPKTAKDLLPDGLAVAIFGFFESILKVSKQIGMMGLRQPGFP